MMTKEHFKRFAIGATFVTGCFIRSLPVLALVIFMLVVIGHNCLDWLHYIFTADERCAPNDIYSTKLTEYFLVIVYFACFFAIMYFSNPNRKKKSGPRKPPIQGELFND